MYISRLFPYIQFYFSIDGDEAKTFCDGYGSLVTFFVSILSYQGTKQKIGLHD